MESGRDDLSSHLLIFPSVLDRGKEIREGGGSSLGTPEIVPKVRLLLLLFSFSQSEKYNFIGCGQT